MGRIDGYPAKEIANARKAAADLMAKFDANKDGFISKNETERNNGITSSVYSDRLSDTMVWRTVTTNQHFQNIHDFGAVDHNGDNRISIEEVTEKAVLDTDSNKDGKLSWGERTFSTWAGKVWDNVKSRSVEIARQRDLVYDPIEVRPTPPSIPSDYDRPRPPSISPPSGDRPRPPGSSPSGDRPRPPSL